MLTRNLHNYEKIKGEALTKDEKLKVEKLTKLQYKTSGITDKTNDVKLNLRGEQTNELAKRGGFASSVVRDKGTDINYQILSNVKKLVTKVEEGNQDRKGQGVVR